MPDAAGRKETDRALCIDNGIGRDPALVDGPVATCRSRSLRISKGGASRICTGLDEQVDAHRENLHWVN